MRLRVHKHYAARIRPHRPRVRRRRRLHPRHRLHPGPRHRRLFCVHARITPSKTFKEDKRREGCAN